MAPLVLAKVESPNPGGSVKDRMAVVLAAEQSGELHPGGTIVETTSGNTSLVLATVAARRGYYCIFVRPDKMSAEKTAVLLRTGPRSSSAPRS